jgi:proline dehydrogenase
VTSEEYTPPYRLVAHRRPAADTPGSINRAGARRPQALLEAEEAIADPLRMARCLLAGKAVTDIVTAAAGSHNHRNQVTAAHRDGH